MESNMGLVLVALALFAILVVSRICKILEVSLGANLVRDDIKGENRNKVTGQLKQTLFGSEGSCFYIIVNKFVNTCS
jgi:hypothetical protein